jgi:hypothetical protein
MGRGRIFTRRRGFTPLSLLVAALDLAAVALAATLWWIAWVERDGENMPWLFGAIVLLAVLALAAWAISAGRSRAALGIGTILMVVAALIALFG